MNAPPRTRREQVVAATLALLAELPMEEVTTRRVATALGLTQPALFRHFDTREALLLAVVERARTELTSVAGPILAAPEGAEARLARLGLALLTHVRAHPGLPRLLFASVLPSAGAVREAMAELLASRHEAVVSLVRAGQQTGQFDPAVAAEDAATLYIAMLQGLVLRWEAAGRQGSARRDFARLFALWTRAVAIPTAEGHAPAEAPPPGPTPDVHIDGTALLAAGIDPLATVLAAAAALTPGQLLAVDAPFRPLPLAARLRGLGLSVEELPRDDGGWRLTARSPR